MYFSITGLILSCNLHLGPANSLSLWHLSIKTLNAFLIFLQTWSQEKHKAKVQNYEATRYAVLVRWEVTFCVNAILGHTTNTPDVAMGIYSAPPPSEPTDKDARTVWKQGLCGVLNPSFYWAWTGPETTQGHDGMWTLKQVVRAFTTLTSCIPWLIRHAANRLQHHAFSETHTDVAQAPQRHISWNFHHQMVERTTTPAL
jgi:hypothetical protein